MTKLTFKVLSFLVFFAGLANAANAANPISLSPEQTESINKISAYMNSFMTLQGEFTQIGPTGKVSKGLMFLSKPGKLRFDYAAPNPFLLVSDGRWVTFKNRAKEKGDQFPLATTPLRLVVAEEIDLLNDTKVMGFEHADGITSVVLEERDGVLGGQIMLIFDETQNLLQQWVIIDGKGRRTTVELANLETDVEIDPKLFVVKINRKEKTSR
jgi:outer membrane lipoprotein-sorting protein